jgi:hypothetical protein
LLLLLLLPLLLLLLLMLMLLLSPLRPPSLGNAKEQGAVAVGRAHGRHL